MVEKIRIINKVTFGKNRSLKKFLRIRDEKRSLVSHLENSDRNGDILY